MLHVYANTRIIVPDPEDTRSMQPAVSHTSHIGNARTSMRGTISQLHFPFPREDIRFAVRFGVCRFDQYL